MNGVIGKYKGRNRKRNMNGVIGKYKARKKNRKECLSYGIAYW